MNKMKISQAPYIPLTFDEEVAFLIKEYEEQHVAAVGATAAIKIDANKSKK
jgi:hypothetical protein